MVQGRALVNVQPNPLGGVKSNDKVANIIAIALGVIMFTFGFLKVFDPFNSWFHVQIANSHLSVPCVCARHELRPRTNSTTRGVAA